MRKLGSPIVFKRKIKSPNSNDQATLNSQNKSKKSMLKLTLKKTNKKSNVFKKQKKAEKIEMAENFEEEEKR